MNKPKLLLLAVFCAVLFVFVLLASRAAFHDTHEYITVAKELAGIHNVNVHSGHSFLYGAYLAAFVKAAPAMWAIKLANALWLAATAGLLLFSAKSSRAFLLFATSPLVWWLSPQITPVLPAAFFFALAYLSAKTFESTGKMRWLAPCGLALGLSFAFYEPMVLLIALFLPLFFYEKQFKLAIITAAFALAGVLPRLALDYYLFHNLFYSVLRYVGSNVSITLGKTNPYLPVTPALILAILLAITPLIFLSYKIDWKRYWREGLMLLVLFVFFALRTGPARGIKYFLLFAPILFLVLSTKITRRQVLLGTIASLIIVAASVSGHFIEFNQKAGGFSFFGETRDAQITKDIMDISRDGYEKLISSGAGTAYAAYLFGDRPFIYWWKEYDAAITGKATYSDVGFKQSFSRISLLEQLELRASLNVKPNDFSGARFLFEKGERLPEGLELEKCYRVLCIYQKAGDAIG